MTREIALEAALRNLIEVVEWADKTKDIISKDSIVMEAAREALAIPSTYVLDEKRRQEQVREMALPIDECDDPDHASGACPTCFTVGGF